MAFELFDIENLKLRKIDPGVHTFVHTNYDDQKLGFFLGCNTTEELEREKEKFSKGLKTYNRSYLYFQVLDQGHERVLGTVGYHTWYQDHARAELFYIWKEETQKGKGTMSKILPFVLNYGFEEMYLHRVEALVGTKNVPSLKLLQKFGFKQEGHLREHYFVNGMMEDSLVFSLLRSEFKNSNNLVSDPANWRSS